MPKEFQDKIWCVHFGDLKPGDCFILPLFSFPYPTVIHKKTEEGSASLTDNGKWLDTREKHHPIPADTPVVPIKMPTQIVVKI